MKERPKERKMQITNIRRAAPSGPSERRGSTTYWPEWTAQLLSEEEKRFRSLTLYQSLPDGPK